MNFSRIGQWAQLSDDGHYSVACVRVNDLYRFEAWHLNGGPGKDASLGVFDDAEAARNACREHKGRVAA